MTYGNGQRVFYTYNTLGQVETVGYTGQPSRFQYTYAADGSLASIYDSCLYQTTVYTETGYQINSGAGGPLYSYEDGEGSNYTETVNGVIYQSIVQTDENSSAKQIRDSEGVRVLSANTCYDSFNRLYSKSVQAAAIELERNYTYDTDESGSTGSLVKGYAAVYTVGDHQTTLSFNYTYDGNGNIIGITGTERSGTVSDIIDPQPPVSSYRLTPEIQESYSTTYAYDEAGQLMEAVDGETGKTYRYTYDASGNIQTARTYTVSPNGNEALIDETTYQYVNGILCGYASSTKGNVTYQTDQMGNPTVIGFDTLTWGEGRMLTGIRRNAQNYTAYTYNADGLRAVKAVVKNGITTNTHYVWGDNGLAAAITGNQTVVVLYDAEGESVGFSVNETVYTYVKNFQGDVIRILDEDGTAVVSYTYDPWGVPTVSGDADLAAINPCSYRGYYYDQETGYYYLQSRYYDPEIGRFLNTDDTEMICTDQGGITQYNLFLYCQNNAISNSDPTGYGRLTVILKVSFLRRWCGRLCSMIAKAIALYIFKGAKWAGVIGAALGWIIGRTLAQWMIKKDIRLSVYIPFMPTRTWTLY